MSNDVSRPNDEQTETVVNIIALQLQPVAWLAHGKQRTGVPVSYETTPCCWLQFSMARSTAGAINCCAGGRGVKRSREKSIVLRLQLLNWFIDVCLKICM